MFKLQSECVRIKGEKTLLEAEVESSRRKLLSLESKFKQAENSLQMEYGVEIERLKEKNKQLMEKVEDGKFVEQRLEDLQVQEAMGEVGIGLNGWCLGIQILSCT